VIGWRRHAAGRGIEGRRGLGGDNGFILEGEGEEKGRGCTVHVLSSDLIGGMVVTGSLSLSPSVFNGAKDALE
jgi:hypothetical protein